MIENDLRSYLIGHQAVQALIGNRLYPGSAAPPNAAKPYVLYAVSQRTDPLCLKGGSGYAVARFQLAIWGDLTQKGYDQVKDVAATLRTVGVLHGLNNRRIGDPTTGTWILHVRIEDEADSPEDPPAGFTKSDSNLLLTVVVMFQT